MRRSVLAPGVALEAGVFAFPMSAWATSVMRLSASTLPRPADCSPQAPTRRSTRCCRYSWPPPRTASSRERPTPPGPPTCGCSPPSSPTSRAAPRPPAPTRNAGIAARHSGDPVALAAAARADGTDEALLLLREAHAHLTTAGPRPTASKLGAAGMTARTAAYTTAQAHRPTTAYDFAAQAEQINHRLAHHPHPPGHSRELTADQCALYGIHRHLNDFDTALAHARRLRPVHLPTAEGRARAPSTPATRLAPSPSCVSSSSLPRWRPAGRRCAR